MIQMKNYGLPDPLFSTAAEGIPARILAIHKERYQVVCSLGEAFAKVKPGVYYNNGAHPFPTVGDFVLLAQYDRDNSQIIATLPRKSYFSRKYPAPGRGEQAVAANFDLVFISTSLNHDLNLRRLERYLTLSWESGGTPVILLTKSDLMEDRDEKERILAEVSAIASGVPVIAVSVKTGEGLEALRSYLAPGKTVVFLGSSGVGKSSLTNALAEEEIMPVNGVRNDDRGRHTTTHRQLFLLSNGVIVIDTPGMRTLGMWNVTQGLEEVFEDIEPYLGRCKFSDCTHVSEPGCVIRRAIEEGALSAERWESYSKLKKEANSAQRQKEAFQKRKQEHSTQHSRKDRYNRKNDRGQGK